MVQNGFGPAGATHNPAVRALVRFRSVVPVIFVPLCVVLGALGIQAAVFSRPSRNDLVAAQALRTLLGYRVIRATEDIGRRTSAAICVQGWFHAPRHRRPVRGELVLIGREERLYDFGSGIRHFGDRRRVNRLDRLRFMLAGCPRFVGAQVSDALIRNRKIDVDPRRADGLAAESIVFGKRQAPIDLLVARHTYKPVELALSSGPVRGWSDLEPGGTPAVVSFVRHAFHLRTPRVRRA